ncbi:MAG: alpha/beta hydrolase family protein [Candidatus Helarchaeota archaeon]
MFAKYFIPILIITTIVFWICAFLLPTQATFFLLLRNITFGILIFYGGLLIGMLVMLLTEYKNIEYEHLRKEPFELTLADGIKLYGEILTGKTTDSSPVVLACHGWGSDMTQLYPMVYPLVVQGYKVVCYNHRGHGKKPYKSGGNKSDIDKTFMDVQQVVDFIEKRPDLNHEKLGAIGFSLGGYTLLTGGYLDPRIKLIIAFCAGHDWLEMNEFWAWYIRLFYRLDGLIVFPNEDLNRKLSPKYFLQKPSKKIICLSHAKNDRIVPYDGFLKNKKLLTLPDENTLSFKKGDHGFFGQWTIIVSQMIKWLNDYL